MNFGDLIIYLRNRTVEAYQVGDEQTLQRLFATLNDIADAIEVSGDATYWTVVDDLIDSIRHMGLAEFKVHIPSEDDIRKLQRK